MDKRIVIDSKTFKEKFYLNTMIFTRKGPAVTFEKALPIKRWLCHIASFMSYQPWPVETNFGGWVDHVCQVITQWTSAPRRIFSQAQKYQSGGNLVCQGSKRWRETEVCWSVITLHAKYCSIILVFFPGPQIVTVEGHMSVFDGNVGKV